MTTKNKTFSFRPDPQLFALLTIRAAELGIERSKLINVALLNFFQNHSESIDQILAKVTKIECLLQIENCTVEPPNVSRKDTLGVLTIHPASHEQVEKDDTLGVPRYTANTLRLTAKDTQGVSSVKTTDHLARFKSIKSYQELIETTERVQKNILDNAGEIGSFVKRALSVHRLIQHSARTQRPLIDYLDGTQLDSLASTLRVPADVFNHDSSSLHITTLDRIVCFLMGSDILISIPPTKSQAKVAHA